MSQTIHNFLVSSGSGIALDPRVFDFQISSSAKTYFENAMTALQTAIQNQDTSKISAILIALNNWSQVISIDSTGTQNTYNVDAFGNITAAASVTPGVTPDPSFIPPSIPGLTIPSPVSPDTVFTIHTTMDRYMAETTDQLIRTFRSAGWDPTTGSGNAATAMVTLFSGAGPSIYNVAGIVNKGLTNAASAYIIGDASTQSQSLQQLLMVDYVSTGNALLFNQMSTLKTAIDVNQTALGYLNSLQGLMNQKDPQHFLLALQDLSSFNLNQLTDSQYTQFENDTFNQQLGTVPKFTADDVQTYLNSLSTPDPITQGAVPNQLVSAMANIQTNLTQLIQQIGPIAGSGGLTQALKTIQADFNTAGSVNAWVKDFTTGNTGNYQSDLNNAIVASQAFNDTQRTELSRVMFVFEEFYKSATAMLSRLTQLIEKMGSAIKG